MRPHRDWPLALHPVSFSAWCLKLIMLWLPSTAGKTLTNDKNATEGQLKNIRIIPLTHTQLNINWPRLQQEGGYIADPGCFMFLWYEVMIFKENYELFLLILNIGFLLLTLNLFMLMLIVWLSTWDTLGLRLMLTSHPLFSIFSACLTLSTVRSVLNIFPSLSSAMFCITICSRIYLISQLLQDCYVFPRYN